MVRPMDEDSRGVLDPVRGLAHFRMDRHQPSPAVARFVSWYWAGRWDLPDGRPHTQEVLPRPGVNLVFQAGGGSVHGVARGRTVRVLEGQGWVLGVLFRAGGFRPFSGRPQRELRDRSLPVGEVFGPAGVDLARRVAALGGGERAVAEVDDFLARLAPPGPHPCERVTAIVERIEADPTTVRVEQLAVDEGLSQRHLQRLFAEHVGVSPKWVVRRYRLLEAVERAVRGQEVDWARLAAELGYSDQSHLIRDFTRAVGEPPDRYARRCAAAQEPAGAARA